MKKKWMTLILAALLMLSMAGCGSKNEEIGQQETVAETQESTAAENVTEETAAKEDVTEETAVEETATEETAAEDTGATLGQTLLGVFESEAGANPQATAQELADAVLASEAIRFSGATMPVEAGLLTGFGNAEITGFKEGTVFMPMIGTIPFVGYVFSMEEGADVEGFVQTLTDNADPRWNICTEAEETVVEVCGDKVFFLMCPKTLEE